MMSDLVELTTTNMLTTRQRVLMWRTPSVVEDGRLAGQTIEGRVEAVERQVRIQADTRACYRQAIATASEDPAIALVMHHIIEDAQRTE